MKDEKKHHGAVDEASSEQQLCISNTKSKVIFLVLVGFTGDRRNTDRFSEIEILHR